MNSPVIKLTSFWHKDRDNYYVTKSSVIYFAITKFEGKTWTEVHLINGSKLNVSESADLITEMLK